MRNNIEIIILSKITIVNIAIIILIKKKNNELL